MLTAGKPATRRTARLGLGPIIGRHDEAEPITGLPHWNVRPIRHHAVETGGANELEIRYIWSGRYSEYHSRTKGQHR